MHTTNEKEKMAEQTRCSVCRNPAHFYCGHGCKVAYCGESCARSVYDVHKEQCGVLVGSEQGEQMLASMNYGSAQQTYNAIYTYYTNVVLPALNTAQRVHVVEAFLYATQTILTTRSDLRAGQPYHREIMSLRDSVWAQYHR